MSTFYTCTLILWHQKVVSHFLNQLTTTFHIEIAYDTFQFLNCVIGKINKYKRFAFICKLTYSFVAMNFGVFLKCIFPIFPYQKCTQICG